MNSSVVLAGSAVVVVGVAIAVVAIRRKLLEELTLDEVITEFVEKRPETEDVRGAILVERRSQRWLLTLLFIDKNNDAVKDRLGRNPIRSVWTMHLDAGLLELIGDRDLVVLE